MNNNSAVYPSLKNKVVFILGGSSGIGADFVEAFAKQGSKVAFVGRNEKLANALIEKLSDCSFVPKFYKCDIVDLKTLEASIEHCIKHIGHIGVLLNNAANDERHEFNDTTHEYFDWEYQTNLRPHVFTAKAVIKSMIELGSGTIINLGSIGWMRKNDKTILYGIFKSSMNGLTNGLARRYGKNKINQFEKISKEFGQSLVSSILFTTNIFFWIKTDYWSQSAELTPAKNELFE